MKKYIGDKTFYRMVFALALPMLLQNTVSNFVNLLDNLMVGQTGTEQMSGVSIVNMILFVYNLCLFGGTSGAGIFGAQFYGKKDTDGVRYSLRFNLIVVTVFTALAIGVLSAFGTRLIGTFLHDDGTSDLVATLAAGQGYLRIMLLGLPAFALTNAYSGILRGAGHPKIPMTASIVALLVNLGGNWVLIFGHLGFEAMGIRGAAVATVLSRYVEAALILLFTHGGGRCEYAAGVLKNFRIPGALMKRIAVKSLPLLCNEFFWSLSQTVLTQCYSLRGLSAVAALNINSVITMFCGVVTMSLGNCVGVILGNELGAGDFERARADCPRLAALTVTTALMTSVALFLVAPLVPRLYNTTDAIRDMATHLAMIAAVFEPFLAYTNTAYFALRSGGRTEITVIFDSAYSWAFMVPLAWILSRKTTLPLLAIYACVCSTDVIKAVFGGVLLKKGVWIRNIVTE